MSHAAQGTNRQREVIRRVANATASVLDLPSLLETAYREVSSIFQTDTFFVALYNAKTRQIEFPFMVDEGVRSETPPVPLGQGLTSHVIATRQPLLIHNRVESAQVSELPKLYGSMRMSESWLGIPLIVGHSLIGVVNVQSYEPDAYGDEHLALLSIVADQLAVGIEHARLHEQIRRRAYQMAVVSDVGSKIAALLDPDTLLASAVELIRDRFGYDQVMYLDHCPTTGEVTVRVGVGRIVELVPLGSKIPIGAGLIGRVARSGEPALVPDVRQDPDYYNPYPKALLTRSELVVPVLIAGSVAGVLDLQSNDLDAFSDEDSLVLRTLASQFAVALNTAHLYQAAQTELAARRQAEERANRYVAELESANEEIKQFAYIVSHDLRAPLVNLKGFSAELRESIAAVLPVIRQAVAYCPDGAPCGEIDRVLEQDVPEALAFIESSVARMDGFINAVLKLSRIGRRTLAPEPVDVACLVSDIRKTLTHQMEAHKATLVVNDLPTVVADRTAMEQILGNLLSNAVNYLDPARPGQIEVGGRRETDCTAFWVRDNGRGITPEDEDKVFAPFRRAGRQDVPGEGMGLSYVWTMVKRHGGRIWFESQPDVGTQFTFTIAEQLEERTTV